MCLRAGWHRAKGNFEKRQFWEGTLEIYLYKLALNSGPDGMFECVKMLFHHVFWVIENEGGKWKTNKIKLDFVLFQGQLKFGGSMRNWKTFHNNLILTLAQVHSAPTPKFLATLLLD